MLKQLGRNRRLGGTSFLACICFIALAVYGWGVSWGELLSYALLLLTFMLALLLVAGLLGWLLHKFNRRK